MQQFTYAGRKVYEFGRLGYLILGNVSPMVVYWQGRFREEKNELPLSGL